MARDVYVKSVLTLRAICEQWLASSSEKLGEKKPATADEELATLVKQHDATELGMTAPEKLKSLATYFLQCQD
eukprot:9885400-Karenia_brevis.AAC.1